MNSKLKMLAKSAMAIPGMIATVNAAGPADTELSYRYTFYGEDATPETRDDSGGSQNRYKIHVNQFHILAPVAGKYSVDFETSYEVMSGASPEYTYIPESGDEVVTHFAGASEEKRIDVSVSGRRYGKESDFGLGGYWSSERDYRALSSSLDGRIQFNQQMTTISGGISGGYDVIEPTTSREPGSEDQAAWEPARYFANEKTKWQISVFEGVGQIIDMNTVVQANVSFTYKNGYLSDAYRDCPHAQNVPCDIRPSSRSMGTLTVGVRRFIPSLNSAIHADYRAFVDTWDIASHTLDINYYQNWIPGLSLLKKLDMAIQLIPGFRYYQQSAAFFYEVPDVTEGFGGYNYTADTDTYYSSDPRLANYGAVSAKLGLNIDIKSASIVMLAERYAANPSFGFNSDEDIPGLPAYWRFSGGLDYSF